MRPRPILLAALSALALAAALALAPAARAQVAEAQKLLASDASHDARFGDAVALVETETEALALVGAPHDEEAGGYAGAAYAFRYDEATGVWVEEAKLLPEGAGPYSTVGRSVALAADRSTALVGGGVPGEDIFTPGLVHVFARTGGAWVEQARLSPDDSALGDEFGCGLGLSATGAVIVVGACGADGAYNASGAAYVFRRDDEAGAGSTAWVQEAKVSTTSFCFFTSFGRSVGVSASGDRFIVGESCVHQGDVGHAHVFHRSGPPEGANGGWGLEVASEPVDPRAVALSAGGDLAVAGVGPGGGVVVLRREGATWVAEGEIRAAGASSNFGRDAVALGGDLALIGDESADVEAENEGAAFLFRRIGEGARAQEAQLVASDGALNDDLGEAVALSARFALVGAVSDGDAGSQTGAAYAYDLARVLPAEGGGPETEAPTLSAYPNPFRSTTTLTYSLGEPGPVRLSVHDVLGREVALLVDGVQAAGEHRVAFDGSRLASGVYLVRAVMEAAERSGRTHAFTQRVTLLR